MRLYLDDDDPLIAIDRATPEGWTRVATASEAIQLLATGQVIEIDLDHDLGPRDTCGDGNQVLDYIIDSVVSSRIHAPVIKLHSRNPSAREKMERGVHWLKMFLRARAEAATKK